MPLPESGQSPLATSPNGVADQRRRAELLRRQGAAERDLDLPRSRVSDAWRRTWIFRREHPLSGGFGRITVGSRVYFGLQAIILPGGTIGDHSTVAAGAPVTKGLAAPHNDRGRAGESDQYD